MFLFFLYTTARLFAWRKSAVLSRWTRGKTSQNTFTAFCRHSVKSVLLFHTPELDNSLLRRYISLPCKDNYLATSVFTAPRQPGWQNSLRQGTKEHVPETNRLPNFCYKTQLKFHFHQEVFLPASRYLFVQTSLHPGIIHFAQRPLV